MTSSRDRRIAKELQDLQADRDSSGVYAAPIDGVNLTKLLGTFPAPPDTPYAGGTFEVDITIPDTYPFKPPQMKFRTKIWHPNVSSQTVRLPSLPFRFVHDRLTLLQGAICLDTLTTAWSPVQTIKTALISLRMLLEFPNPKDPQDAEVAKMLTEDPERFARQAHDWAVKYAGATRKQIDYSDWKKNAAVEPESNDAARSVLSNIQKCGCVSTNVE